MRSERVSRRGLLAAAAIGLVGVGGTRSSGGQESDHVVVFGGSPDDVVEYGLTVSGRLRKHGKGGGAPIADRHVTVDREDGISDGGRHVAGAVAGGGDAYRFTGRIVRFRTSLWAERGDDVGVYVNGRRFRPAELGDAPAAETPIEFLDCNTARVTGEFGGVRMHTSFWDGSELGTNWLFDGPVEGTTVLHPAAEHDPFPFAIDSVSVDTRELETPGQAAKFTADNPYAGPWCRERGPTNHVVVFGGDPRNVVRYDFSVSGRVRKSGRSGGAPVENRHVTVDGGDAISDGRVRGAVAGGGDAYRFTGELTRFETDGDATVFLNGRRVDPSALGRRSDGGGSGDGGQDGTESDGGQDGDGSDGGEPGDGEPDDGEPPRGIEFLDCDRVLVTGTFERVTVSSTWYAPDGIATSYNEIGPVSGRTRIDGSNVGDVAGVNGFAITAVSAHESESAEPTLSKRPTNRDACLRRIRPEKVTASVEGCSATGDGADVTFAYENPNDEALFVRSELVGASSTTTPDELEPGRHTFAARWTPTSPDERLRWRIDVRPFGYEGHVTATSPTAAECGVTSADRTDGESSGDRTETGETATEDATPDPTTEGSESGTEPSESTADPTTEPTAEPTTEASEPATDTPDPTTAERETTQGAADTGTNGGGGQGGTDAGNGSSE